MYKCFGTGRKGEPGFGERPGDAGDSIPGPSGMLTGRWLN